MSKKQDINEPLTRREQIADARRLAGEIQDLQARAKRVMPIAAIPIIKEAATKQSVLNMLVVGLLNE
ncbi:hypothetical protein [Neptunicella sp. SCSIO 80796]|uniref:hypothetical protein n=1 Tax=Neptunicella plasticusilytica TaxID=3117012 RepID=UPI003A4DF254